LLRLWWLPSGLLFQSHCRPKNGFSINRCINIIDDPCSIKYGIRESYGVRLTKQHLNIITCGSYNLDYPIRSIPVLPVQTHTRLFESSTTGLPQEGVDEFQEPKKVVTRVLSPPAAVATLLAISVIIAI
jgi:hypothetical protein